MPRNVPFSAADIVKIWRLKAQNVKVSDIAKQMKRSRSGIYEILSKDANPIVKKRSGRPRKTSQRQDREILRAVSTQKKSIREISSTLAFPISRSTVHRGIQSSKFHRYRRMRRTPMLKLYHRKARVLWAKKCRHFEAKRYS
ncbi:Transposable element Tc3 transposase like protein [Argiope bruennichi]|uniref:Transposable element Tc3 transposase like protein n=1 Tax=Argiope bruennichi TaxID=94029 RepID=A0A8T0FEZ9_ARGBR|nr:Transposable element Tc3 transposase like protein [Argiope bruennichi]